MNSELEVITLEKAKKSLWFSYLDHSMQDLVLVSLRLVERENELREKDEFHDYSFLVFPISKAYEGFLKKVFVEMKLISPEQQQSKHFRVGKSLNPDLPMRYRDEEWVYEMFEQQLVERDQSELAQEAWKVWKKSRNLLFHYWPNHENFITLADARGRVAEVVRLMERLVSCL